MPFADYLIQPGEMTLSPEAIDRKRKLAQLLQQQGTDTSPVQSWTQGAARIAQALAGGLQELRLDKAEKANMDRGNAVLSGLAGALMGGDTSSATPATPSSAPAGSDYFSTMAQKESGGNPNIKNAQGSGATGLYQFMPGTWRGLMEKYPSLGLTYDGMTDPQQQQVAMRQFTADNAKALQAAGIPVNNATLAIAHQQGAGGAIKLLTNPDAPAVNVVGAKAVTMNGGDPRMTAGQFAQKVAGYYMGGSQGLTDRLSPQAAQNVLSGQPGPVPGARADMGAVAAPDRITPQAMQAVMTNQPGPVPGARTDMTASTMPMTLSPQAAGNVMSGQPGPVPGARLPVAQALADIPAAGAQPAGYQIPGQAPMPAPAAPAAMPAQANRAALMQKVIQAWPYLSESQRQQAQMILQMAPKPMTPLEQLQMQEAGLNIAAKQHEQQNWATSDEAARLGVDEKKQNLRKGELEIGQIGKTGTQNDYNFYAQQEAQAGRKPLSFNDWQIAKVREGRMVMKNEGAIPPGYRAIRDADGNITQLELIPGSKEAVAQTKQEAASKATADRMLDAISDIEGKLNDPNAGAVTGGWGSVLSHVPGTTSHDVANTIATLRANSTIEGLNQMRQQSPTGGALGNVTEGEGKMLANRIASLEQSQSAEQFKKNLQIVKDMYTDIVHGPPRPVSTPEEAKLLPKGTRILLPDGRRGVVP